jgi:adenine-specific DNA-methyltransferase
METKRSLPRISGETPDQRLELIEKLKDVVPEAVSEGKIDFERLRSLTGETVDGGPERYTFSWNGKREALLTLQTPTAATLVPSVADGKDFENARNIFIEGENLEVLKIMYRSYFGRVKLIYIDPPYNTGNDFIYPDDFSDPLDHYLRVTGQKGGNGDYLTSRPEQVGRVHSAWLSLMYPRLVLARQLLSENGVLCVSISDHELANLRLLLDQVFGEESFVAQFIWKSRKFPDSRSTTQVSVDHEYILVYRRSQEALFRGIERDETKYQNPDNDPRGAWMSRSILGLATAEQRPNLHFAITDPKTKFTFQPPAETGWRYNSARMHKLIDEGCIIFPAKPEGRPREKKFKNDLQNEFMSIPSIIDDVHTSDGTEEVRKLFGFQAFDFPKPSELIRRFVEQLSGDDDIILDFFAGSCATAQAVMDQSRRDGRMRRYICVQLPEKLSTDSEAFKRGLKTIADIGRHRIRAYIDLAEKNGKQGQLAEINTPPEGFRAFRLASSNLRSWAGVADKSPEGYATQLEIFRDSLLPGWKAEDVIWEVALREGFSLTARFERLPGAKNRAGFWRVTDSEREQSFVITLEDHLDAQSVSALGLSKDDLFVCRDTALDDTLAANLALQCRLKVI